MLTNIQWSVASPELGSFSITEQPFMQSPPSPSGPFPGSAASGRSEYHILLPWPRKTGAQSGWRQAGGAGRQHFCPGWPQHPQQGLPPSWPGAMLVSLEAALGKVHGSAIWLAKRPGGEKKMPRGEDVQKQKPCLGFEGKGRKFSGFMCTSFSPPSKASSN